MTLNEIKVTAEPICRRHRVRRLELFGSRARSEAGTDSDIDFCVLFEELPPSEYSRQFFGLLHDLEDAFHTTVDLLTEASIRKVSLKKNLKTDGVLVYG
jgi:predicted nucleotidyltransferase